MKRNLIVLIGLSLLMLPVHSQRQSVSVDSTWKITMDDRADFRQTDFNYSSWETTKLPRKLKLPTGGGFFWLRTTMTIPEELAEEPIWLTSGKTLAAYDLYVNGEYLGSRGRLPPDYYQKCIKMNLSLFLQLLYKAAT